ANDPSECSLLGRDIPHQADAVADDNAAPAKLAGAYRNHQPLRRKSLMVIGFARLVLLVRERAGVTTPVDRDDEAVGGVGMAGPDAGAGTRGPARPDADVVLVILASPFQSAPPP